MISPRRDLRRARAPRRRGHAPAQLREEAKPPLAPQLDHDGCVRSAGRCRRIVGLASGQLLVGPAGPAGVAGAKGDKGDPGTPAPPEAFHLVGGVGEPAFAAPFANFGGGTATAGFYKDALGIVHLKGLVSGLSVDGPIFTLPVGYRPAEASYFPTMTCAGYGDALINPDGTVRQRTAANGTCYSLDGITFRAA